MRIKHVVKSNLLTIILLISGAIFPSQAQIYEPVKQLAERRVPWLTPYLSFSVLQKEQGHDVFELFTENNKINIAASTVNAASMGLSWYLKYYCNRSMSHLGDNLESALPLPAIEKKIHIAAVFPVRYALNYCTINYSMSFYTWEDWERELDWMALNGVNLMLSTVGIEAVWENTLKQLNYTDKEILDFIAGPAFTGWWLMGNLEGWGGPVTKTMIDQQVILQKKMLERTKDLGIQQVMQGFYGIVPYSLKDKIKLQVIDQGKWAGGFQRPDFLLPADPMFKKIASIYYSEMKKLYGSDLCYFGGDPFHEGGSSVGVNVSEAAAAIQEMMLQYFPESVWVLMGWQNNPTKELLNGLDKSKVLIIELFGENTRNWEIRKGYENTPFIWSNVSNFGEKNGLYGKLQRFADEIYMAKESEYGNLLKGVGIIPEGINNNPVAYDLVLEAGWHNDKIEVKDWINKYVQYRYGINNETVQKAWQLLLETVYSSPQIYQEGPPESIFCARPGIKLKSVSSWGTRERNYDRNKFEEAVKLFVSASGSIQHIETYNTDKIDLVRQFLANRADTVYSVMMETIRKNDIKAFQKASGKFQSMIMQQDSLLNSNKHFRLNTWLQQAVNFGKSENDKSIALKNAKIQITYWGPDYNPETSLHDYAHKEWGGLLSSLYLERWRLFFESEVKKMNNKRENVNYFKVEKEWTEKKDMYGTKPLSQTETNLLIKRILTDFTL